MRFTAPVGEADESVYGVGHLRQEIVGAGPREHIHGNRLLNVTFSFNVRPLRLRKGLGWSAARSPWPRIDARGQTRASSSGSSHFV